jgi:regulator of sigma E protease
MLPLEIVPRVEELKDPFGATHEVRRLGITPHPEASQFERFGPLESVGLALGTTVALTVTTHKAIFYLIMGKLSLKAISGPIGIISLAGDAVELGLPYVLQLTATLSVSLAVINLLPFPALDGGHLLFLLIEAVRRRRVSLAVQERATQVGFIVLMALMAFIIYNDLVNLDVFGRFAGLFRPAPAGTP